MKTYTNINWWPMTWQQYYQYINRYHSNDKLTQQQITEAYRKEWMIYEWNMTMLMEAQQSFMNNTQPQSAGGSAAFGEPASNYCEDYVDNDYME